MPTAEWLNKYESIKDKLACKTDLDAHFTEKVIGNMGVDVLDIGAVHFPTGTIFACDPLVELEDTPPFLQTIPAGTYPVKICVVPSEKYGDRYACVKVEVSREKPVRYELGMTGKEDLDEELGEDDYFGFAVDAGMGCIMKNMEEAIVPAIYGPSRIDLQVMVESEEAIAMARQIIAREGIFAGMSSGAAMIAALHIAERIDHGNIVVIFPDRAEKYLSTTMFADLAED